MLADALEAGSVLLVAGAGYGKTMALEEAIEVSGRRAVWLSCRDVGGDAGRLLISVVEWLRRAEPGLADVLGERLAAGLEPVDVPSATAALLAELDHLLVEPLVIVLDDAEELESAPEALALVGQLLGVRGAPLSLAIATRRPLALRLGKLRAAGRLTEVGPPELSFTAGECEALLRLRHGREVTTDEVEAAIGASEGWPMGVATATGDHLFEYLAEEVLDRLHPAMRLNVVDSSVPDSLTPELVEALGLPPDFLGEAERSGLFLRAQASGAHSYHPLFRAFLRERLGELRTEDEVASLHARAAAGLAGSDRRPEAIEHWLQAGRFEEALAELSANGAGLVRTSPGTVRAWLAALPEHLRGRPDYLLLEAQLLWGAGHHERALDPLRTAVSGYREGGDADGEWLARVFLADTLFFLGAFADVTDVSDGWQEASGPIAGVAAVAVAWYEVVALATLGRFDEADALRARLGRDPDAGQFGFLDVLTRAGLGLAAGDTEAALELLRATIAELELNDPFGRLPYALGMVLVILRNLGEREEALEWLDRCESESERVGLGFALRDFRLQRASLLAQGGDLSRAEVELARGGTRPGAGWLGVYEAEAEAHVASLRGDAPAAVAAARRALESGARAPVSWRALATVEMADVLTQAGAPDTAHAAIDATLAELDERYPAERGRLHRAWLLASRARLEHKTGDPDAAGESLAAAWAEARASAARLVRAHWPAVKPVLWHALAEGALAADAVLPAMQDALPGGDALVAMVDHPEPAVRRSALAAALAAGHPAVLERLDALAEDEDPQVAAAAAAGRERLRSDPPSLRFELLGGFRVRRGGWELPEGAWVRPMAARVVRFLLIQGTSAVPEDALFEAFWPDRPADAARQHLAVAVSRARKVLDPPGAEQSVIEARERTYRLRLRERDGVDAAEFETAAESALAAPERDRPAALARAAALWTGEPLPEDRYPPWSFAWRERLTETYCRVLGVLAEGHAATGRHADVVRTAQRLLEVNPLDERAHRRLMLAYARTGRTSYALRQYLECRRALVVELGVEPSAETSGLQARILAGEAV
jgi:ATP/maltotriose-dependent transcriptional regulator MalT/DNA-binding SARP family transcriptional activator